MIVCIYSSISRICAAYNRMERKAVLCPLCRAPWTACLVSSNKSSNEDKYSTRTRLPSLKCSHCRLTIRKQVVRCASCPPLDLCQSCFNGGAGASQDHDHPFFKADVSQYPAEWTAVVPYSSRSNQLREDRERMTLLQHRDLSPADYNELLALDGPAFSAPSLHEHLVNALPDIATSDSSGQKCKYCSISLSVDRETICMSITAHCSSHMCHKHTSISIVGFRVRIMFA